MSIVHAIIDKIHQSRRTMRTDILSPDELERQLADDLNVTPTRFADLVEEGSDVYQGAAAKLREELGEEYHTAYSGGPGRMPMHSGSILYALVRCMNPDTVIETGVAQGMSTLMILQAMEANSNGELHSIDLPKYASDQVEYRDGDFPIEGFDSAVIPKGKEPGWLVPDSVRDRWTLHEGRSTDLLLGVLDQTEPVDLFIHDSEHSYQTILWEISVTWPFVRENGVVWVDDVSWNTAFDDFARGVDSPSYKTERFGLIQKRSEKK